MQDITSPSLEKFFTDVAQPTLVRESTPPPMLEPAPPPPPPAEQKPKPIDKKAIQFTSDILIDFADTTQKNIFRFLANRKQEKKANEITNSSTGLLQINTAKNKYLKNESNGQDIKPLTDKEIELLSLHEKAEKFINDLPFTDVEKEKLLNPLMYVIEKNGGNIPVEIALIMAAANIFGGRVAEMYTF